MEQYKLCVWSPRLQPGWKPLQTLLTHLVSCALICLYHLSLARKVEEAWVSAVDLGVGND